MTIAEIVKQKLESMPPEKQQEVLQFLEFINQRDASPKCLTRQELEQALAASAGIWKDRDDLPQDSAEAARVLRRRVMERGN